MTQQPGHRVGRALAVAGLGVVLVVALGAWLSPDPIVSVLPNGDRVVPVTAWSGPWGFDAEMTVVFPQDRLLVDGAITLAGHDYPVSFYPHDGTDNDVQSQPLPVDAGVSFTASASLPIDCAHPGVPPQLVIQSTSLAGEPVRDSFGVSNPDDYLAAVRDWCGSDLQVTVARARLTPDGHADVWLRIVNPGTQPVSVVSHEFRAQGGRWGRSSVTVAPSGTALLRVTGTDVSCRTPEPWTSGRLTVQGSPIKPYDAGWC